MGPANAAASPFKVVSRQNEVRGRLISQDLGVYEYFQLISSQPLDHEVSDTDHVLPDGRFSFAHSIANGPFVFVAIDEPHSSDTQVPHSDAAAISLITFTPTVNGSAGDISMSYSTPSEGWTTALGPKVSWTISDLTAGTEIPTAGRSSSAGTQVVLASNDYAWDSTHTYQLKLLVQTGSNHQNDGGWLSTNMFLGS